MHFEDRMNLVGRTVGQYQIIAPIGQGGMAAVFKAHQPNLDRFVAIKVLPAQHALTPGFAERFEREAKAVAALNHPNILPIIDYGQDGDLTYIVMKYVEHGTLADRLGAPIGLPILERMIGQIASALDHAHGRGIIHRDIKPSNILLDENDWVQLADFGLARMVTGPSELTGSGASLGSPAFISPEQGQGLPLDQHTDIYSLGVVLYEMATGRLPFEAETAMTLVFKHIYESPPMPRSINPALPSLVEGVILKAMSKTIADRYHSAGDLAHDLSLAIGGTAAVAASDRSSSPIAQIDSAPTIDLDPKTATDLMIESIPAVDHFVGRDKELTAYRSRLQHEGFVAITGMAGTGKTALGAKLAREMTKDRKNIFWYTFDHVERSNIDALFWALAAFLESHGDHNLWRYLNSEPESQKPLDRTVRMNLLLSGLATGQYVLCFDDLNVIGRAPETAYVFKTMRQRFGDSREPSSTKVILLGREMPRDLASLATAPLGGFDYDEASAFVADHQVKLPPSVTLRLWERTEGNPKLLELSVAAIEPIIDDPVAVDKFVDAMSRKGDVRDYLMSNIYETLDDDDKLIMGALSVFPGAIERDDVQTILEDEGLDDVVTRLDGLIARQLIDETAEDELHCHGLVRDYCYHLLSRADKDRFHEGAAEYFEVEKNYLVAAHHFFEKRDFTRALDLLTTNSSLLINSGGASGLVEQLKRFQKKSLSSDQWAALNKTVGDVRKIRGEYQAAVEAYSSALDEPIGEQDRSGLLQQISNLYLRSGDYDRAIDFAQQSFKIDQALGDNAGMARYHHLFGIAEYKRGHIEAAAEQLVIAEQLARGLKDDDFHAQVNMQLGLIAWHRKDLARAREIFEDCRTVFRRKGDRTGESRAIANMGLVYGEMQDVDRQLACYRQSVEIQEEIGDVDGLQYAFNNLGYVYYTLHDYTQSIQYYDRLRKIAKESGQQRWLCLAYAGLADARLGKDDPYRALDDATDAELVGDELGPGRELGVAERVLGDIWLKLGDLERSQAAYERGIPMLEEANELDELASARRGLVSVLEKLGITQQSI
jgi:serine/threonine protein kinase/tetratricopeptide (TPR) repeat protein